RTARITDERPHFVVKDEDGNLLSEADVDVEKMDGTTLFQGKTSSNGEIRLLGADIGDRVLYTASTGPAEWHYLATVLDGAGKIGMDPIDVVLKSVTGEITLIPHAVVDETGSLTYRVASSRPFGENPKLTFGTGDAEAEFELLDLGGQAYGATFDAPFQFVGTPLFEGPDDLGEPFFFRQSIAVFDVQPEAVLRVEGRGVEILLDDADHGASRITVLSSPFPSPAGGLTANLHRVSDLVSVQSSPEGAGFTGHLRMNYFAGPLLAASDAAVGIYRWSGEEWEKLETRSMRDSTLQLVSTNVSGPGHFAVFLDFEQTTRTAVEEEEDGDRRGSRFTVAQNFPNPFSSSTWIPVTLDVSSSVKVTVYNLIGQRVASLPESTLEEGEHAIRLDASRLPAGTYIYRVESHGTARNGIMLVVR
ncbi:MAG TPA: T9SS type A sorting domain-containing protein, partial [Rhodothermales bacterium]|nr:T9SS type A sorting domain-containing protein [Rhodothermales bacterium]